MQFSKLVLTSLILSMLVFPLSCRQQAESLQQHPTKTISSPTGATQTNMADDGSWPMPAKNYESTRYSQLNQINTGNVQNLKAAWTFSTGLNRGHEAAPLVVGSLMYIVTPYPNVLYALDLTEHGTVKWKYEPKPAPASQGVACCDVVNRGAAYSNGKIFFNTSTNPPTAVKILKKISRTLFIPNFLQPGPIFLLISRNPETPATLFEIFPGRSLIPGRFFR
jgi:glucose dehydrogenase